MSTNSDTINTEHVYPPIPIRCFDWMAWRGDMDEGVTTGHGATREAAIANLMEQEGDE